MTLTLTMDDEVRADLVHASQFAPSHPVTAVLRQCAGMTRQRVPGTEVTVPIAVLDAAAARIERLEDLVLHLGSRAGMDRDAAFAWDPYANDTTLTRGT